MDNRPRIRDTSGQDHVVSTPAGSFRRHRKAWLVGGIAGAVVLAMAAWVIVGWPSGGRSYDASRVRIAQVTRGDRVRDLSADGRVLAAHSPTLSAIAAGTVALQVVAGAVGKQGEPQAVIVSPALRQTLVASEHPQHHKAAKHPPR